MILQYEDRIELLKSGLLPHDAVCAEVGACEGHFANLIKEHTAPKVMHLIDIWSGIGACGWERETDNQGGSRLQTVASRFRSDIKLGKVMLHQGLSVNVLPLFPDDYFDWVYVDADHSHDGALNDFLAAESKTRLLAAHDFCDPSSKESDGIKQQYPGVFTAVMEFCETRKWKIVATTQVGPWAGIDAAGSNCPSCVLERVSCGRYGDTHG